MAVRCVWLVFMSGRQTSRMRWVSSTTETQEAGSHGFKILKYIYYYITFAFDLDDFNFSFLVPSLAQSFLRFAVDTAS